MKFAKVVAGVVAQVAVFESQADAAAAGFTARTDNQAPEPGIGWSFDGVVFSPPAAPAPTPLTWGNAPAEYFWIDPGPFLDRFGPNGHAIMASTDNDVRAVVTNLLFRQYVDLKRADIPPMLDLLISKGLINAADKTVVLTQQTTDYERHMKGLPQP